MQGAAGTQHIEDGIKNGKQGVGGRTLLNRDGKCCCKHATPHQKDRLDHWYSSVQFITELNGRFHRGIRADIHGQNVYERATWVGGLLVPKTVNPRAASSSAVAHPMHDDAPVTSAIWLDFIIKTPFCCL